MIKERSLEMTHNTDRQCIYKTYGNQFRYQSVDDIKTIGKYCCLTPLNKEYEIIKR